ncbi:MAG: hypothetical protein WDN67_03435 [Candidatus Moraniibacteriota bacterium]
MEISIAAEKLFSIGAFPVTNAFLIAVVIACLLAFLTIRTTRRFQEVPRGFQNILEIVLEFLLDLIESVTGNRKQALQFFPAHCDYFPLRALH